MTETELLLGTAAQNGGAAHDQSAAEEDCAVQVAVHIRPLIDSEQEAGCEESLFVTPGAPQVGCPDVFAFELTHAAARGVHACVSARIKDILGCGLLPSESVTDMNPFHRRLRLEHTPSPMTMHSAALVASQPAVCIRSVCSHWSRACSKATTPQRSPTGRLAAGRRTRW